MPKKQDLWIMDNRQLKDEVGQIPSSEIFLKLLMWVPSTYIRTKSNSQLKASQADPIQNLTQSGFRPTFTDKKQ